MFVRVLVLVLSMGATGITLLAIRQQEHLAAHELARTRLEIMRIEDERRRVRAALARDLSPAQVRMLSETLGPLAPAIQALDAPAHEQEAVVAQDAT